MTLITQYQHNLCEDSLQANIKLYFERFGKREIYDHTEDVVSRAITLSQRFDYEQDKLVKAAYLHDLGQVVDKEQIVELCRTWQHVFEDGEDLCPSILHQIASRILAKEVFLIDDQEILEAVSVHTTLKAEPSQLDKLLFLSDKLSWKEPEWMELVTEMEQLMDRSLEAPIQFYFEMMHEKRAQLKCYHIKSQEAYAFFSR